MSHMTRVLINASNLHYGGGVQVAVSFIYDCLLARCDFNYIVSSKVYDNLKEVLPTKEMLNNISILDVYGFSSLKSKDKKMFAKFDLCFTIFGPFYYQIPVDRHICGFAQPWVAYPKNEVYGMISTLDLVKTKLKFCIQKYFFSKYDLLIVEQEHVKDALIEQGFKRDNIKVVSNAVSSVFFDKKCWSKVTIPNELSDSSNLTLGFIGRNYIHKNLKILSKVDSILKNKFNLTVNFLFTLSDDEMKENEFDKIKNFYSVGSLSLSQCPSFYQFIDALIFPSLLECFSATPIEAKIMGKPIFASNRSFITGTVDINRLYLFEPTSADSIASTIELALRSEKFYQEDFSFKYMDVFTSEMRTNKYLDIIDNFRSDKYDV
ncbi:glycosyltransferase [Vibrio harveyi]|uniref:glycosyltransferase n=1 Tax=Vibrio harveyi TaxID=669 RepID=UPI003399AD60